MVRKIGNLRTQKRGWIKIVEAFIAILLLASVVLIVINTRQGDRKQNEFSAAVQNAEVGMLRDIELNDALREEILGISSAYFPIEWEEFDTRAPETKARIEDKTPAYLNCTGRLCTTSDPCIWQNSPNETIYAESVVISSTLTQYNPRILKLFCYVK